MCFDILPACKGVGSPGTVVLGIDPRSSERAVSVRNC